MFSYFENRLIMENLACRTPSYLNDFDSLTCENVQFRSEKMVLRIQNVTFNRCSCLNDLSILGRVEHLNIISFSGPSISIDEMVETLRSLHIQEYYGQIKISEMISYADSSMSQKKFFTMENNTSHIHGYTVSGTLSWPKNNDKVFLSSCFLDGLVIKDSVHIVIEDCYGYIFHSDCDKIFLDKNSKLVLVPGFPPIYENVGSFP